MVEVQLTTLLGPSSLLPRLHGHAGAGSLRVRHPLRVRHLQPEDPGRVAGMDGGVQPFSSPGPAEAPSPASPLGLAEIGAYGCAPVAQRLLEPELGLRYLKLVRCFLQRV